MTRTRSWWVVRDIEGCDAEYDTEHEAINDMQSWWMVEFPQHAPYRLIRCDLSETEVGLPSEEANA